MNIKYLGMVSALAMSLGMNAAFSETMCADDDVVAIVLDPSIAGTNYTYNTLENWWRTTFPYGVIEGTSACLSSNDGKSTGGYVYNKTDTNANGETKPVVGGERNGQYCWCKMTHPAASAWVFNGDRGSDSNCASNCTNYCGNRAQFYSSLRGGMFGSVVQ